MSQYPVEWNGKTYLLHDLTVGIKESFCRWVVRWNGMQQIQTYSDLPHILNPLLASIPALVYWDPRRMSKLVGEMLEHPAGNLQLNRLLFGDSAKTLNDADLQEMMSAKEDEQQKANEKAITAGMEPPFPPVNDYFLAMQQIRETADPKTKAVVG